jgi:hypothetical protein
MVRTGHQADRRLDSSEIFLDGSATYLDLDMGVSSLQMALYFVGQGGEIAVRPIPATTDVAGNGGRLRAAVETFGQHMPERAIQNFRQCVPYRGLDRPDRHRAFGITAWLLPLRHASENFCGIDQPGLVQQLFRRRREDARNESRPHRRTAGVSPGRIERIARHRLAATHDVGGDRDDRGGHFGKIESGIPHRRPDGNSLLGDGGDAQFRSDRFRPA